MQNLFFLGIILVGKEKIQNKNTKTIQKTEKNQSITFCCGDCKNKHGGGDSGPRGRGRGPEGPEGSLQVAGWLQGRTTEEKGLAGAQTAAAVKKERGFLVFSAAENSETKTRTHAVSSSPINCISKMCSGASKVLVTSFISLFTSKLSLKLSTEKQSLGRDWLCVHRNTNTTRYVLVGLL